jgi:hypothetical protein
MNPISLVNVKEGDQESFILNTVLKLIKSFPFKIYITLYTTTQVEFKMKEKRINSMEELRFMINLELGRMFEKRFRASARVCRNRIPKSDIHTHAIEVSEDDYEDKDFAMYYSSEIDLNELSEWKYFEICLE